MPVACCHSASPQRGSIAMGWAAMQASFLKGQQFKLAACLLRAPLSPQTAYKAWP